MTRYAYSTGLPGDYIILGGDDPAPEGFVLDAPPEAEDGQIVRWDGSAWQQAPIPEPVEPEIDDVPGSISRRQLILALATMELITPEEALAAARNGEVPGQVQAAFDNLPPADKLAAEVTWATMSVAERNHPLVALLAAANDMSTSDVDDFFRLAATL